jgi:hypothetical protein
MRSGREPGGGAGGAGGAGAGGGGGGGGGGPLGASNYSNDAFFLAVLYSLGRMCSLLVADEDSRRESTSRVSTPFDTDRESLCPRVSESQRAVGSEDARPRMLGDARGC